MQPIHRLWCQSGKAYRVYFNTMSSNPSHGNGLSKVCCEAGHGAWNGFHRRACLSREYLDKQWELSSCERATATCLFTVPVFLLSSLCPRKDFAAL